MSSSHLDDDDIFGADFQGNPTARRSGIKRSFGDLDDDEDDIFGSKKANVGPKETAPGEVTKTIIILRESLQNCKDSLAACQSDNEAVKSEILKWHSAFQNESFMPMGKTPEPKYVLNYLHTLRSSEESLKEQLEKAKKKEAAFIVTFAKREQEIAELKSAVRDLRAQLRPPSMQARKLLLDPAIHEEFTRLKNLVEEKDKKLKELQENIDAVNFTPNSKMGKMLMAKCKTLMEENEEIGNQASEGKIHELTMKLSLQKTQYAELRNQFEGLYKHIDCLADNVEKSNEMVYVDRFLNETNSVNMSCNTEMKSLSYLNSVVLEVYYFKVLILQEKLEENDTEIQMMKDQLRKSTLQKEEQDNPITHETTNEAINKEHDNESAPLEEIKVEDKTR